MRRVHYDWLEAGEHAQRTVASLVAAVAPLSGRPGLAGEPPHHGHPARHREQGAGRARGAADGAVMADRRAGADIELAMERPLFTPPIKPAIAEPAPAGGRRGHRSFGAVRSGGRRQGAARAPHSPGAAGPRAGHACANWWPADPLQQGLAELVAYLQLGSEAFSTVVDEDTSEPIRLAGHSADGSASSPAARGCRA